MTDTTQPPAETLAEDPVREAIIVLDVFLAAYARRPDDMPVYLDRDDDNLLRWAHLRTILAALTRRAGGDASCKAAPDHADIMETIQNAADDWQKKGYATALAEVRDMANVGRALMEALPEGYSYNDCPSEIVSDLQNERDDAIPAVALPQHIGRVHLGKRRSDGERLCGHGHEVSAGHPLYWPEQISQYDDSDPLCLAHAIEQLECDNADWDTPKPTAGGEAIPAGEVRMWPVVGPCQTPMWETNRTSGQFADPVAALRCALSLPLPTPKPPAGGEAGAGFVERVCKLLRDEQDRLDAESGDYLMDTSDCIDTIRENAAALGLPAPVVEGE